MTSTSPTVLNVYLIDTVKGSILYHATHENAGSSHPVQIAQIENSVVYHFWSENFNEKGYVVVAYELYESENEDQRFEGYLSSIYQYSHHFLLYILLIIFYFIAQYFLLLHMNVHMLVLKRICSHMV